MLKKLYNLINTIHLDPLTVKKAILLCFFVMGFRFAAGWLFSKFHISVGIIPDLLFLAVILLTARMMGRDELRRILAWRDVPLAVFAGVMIMFSGLDIITSELYNIFNILLPVPDNFFDGWFYKPRSVFLIILTGALLPGISEEIFFRGIIARRFFRAYSPVKSILVSAALFGLFHLNPWQAVNAFYFGIFLGWIYRRYKTIWLCMFTHACHNFLVDFMPYPYIAVKNAYYLEMWRHPLWFDIMGLLLFAFGLFTLIVLGRKKQAEQTAAKINKGEIK